MLTLDVCCQDSYNAQSPFLQNRIHRTFGVGPVQPAYLFFSLPVCLPSRILQAAKLLLFPFPNHYYGKCPTPAPFHLYPLTTPYSLFSAYYPPPTVDCRLRVDFAVPATQCCAKIDLTEIVKNWYAGSLENRGLLLTAEADAPSRLFASADFEVAGMRPQLRITCREDTPLAPLSDVSCDVALHI